MAVKEVDSLRRYGIPWRGNSTFHQELAYYATDDDLVLGVVVRDRVDHDFSWVLIVHTSVALPKFDNQITDSGYHTVDTKVSMATQEIATKELHRVMQERR
jgi:hypothetical protein